MTAAAITTKMVYQYAFKEAARLPGSLDPQKVGDHLANIRIMQGSLTAELVVDAARPANAPTHDAFEWNDSEAAKQYRLEQARLLVRSVVLLREDEDKAPIRAFVFVEGGKGPRYEEVNVVMADVDLRAEALATALKELDALRRRYDEYEELAEVFQAVDRTRAQLAVTVSTR